MALSGIELSAGIVVGTGSPIDAKYGPYPDLATAKSEVIPSFRYKGLTIGIETAGVITEYWWEDGLTDNDLVVKSSTSELVDDTTPQLGGDLDLNNNDITGTGNIDIAGDITTSGEFIGDLNGSVFVQVYNSTASTINKGDAVYLTGGNNGDKPHVDLADSSDVNKMPALGIVKENINPSSDGEVVVSGKINFNSHGFTAGANLFINGLGALQETAPTGEGSLIQKIGKVVSPNIILVQGAFRSNATPNLDDGNIFIGDASNQASTTPFAISLDPTPQLSGDLDLNGHGISYASGLVITDALDEDDMSSDSSTAVPTQQSAKAYTDNGDEKVSQTFTNVSDTSFTIDFNSEDFTINRHITSITGNLTCTVSNAVSGSQFVIDVSVASGETNHELIFSGPSSPTIIPDFVNGTSDGLIFGGSSSAATKYTAIGWYNGTEWRINVIDWN